jgi:hypothetical protein
LGNPAIFDQCQEVLGWKANGKKWDRLAPVLEPLLDPSGKFALLSKAFELLMERPALTAGVKVITDLRPVFDDEADGVRAMLLTSTLVLEYQEGKRRQRLHLTLDMEDLRNLKLQIERAEKKARVLEESLAEKGAIVLIPGN